MRIPKRLGTNPIIDATAEVRFFSTIPGDAVIGLVYATLRDTFGELENLPILQIPTELREKDPHLKYQPCYRLTKPGNVLLAGPHTVALSTTPYVDWTSTSLFLREILSRLEAVRLFETIERLGLRYINFFEDLNICEHSTLTLEVRKRSIASQSLTLKTEVDDSDGFKVVTQVANRANAQVLGVSKNGSVIDIDVSNTRLSALTSPSVDSVLQLFGQANSIADGAFFGLLTDELIKTFQPEY